MASRDPRPSAKPQNSASASGSESTWRRSRLSDQALHAPQLPARPRHLRPSVATPSHRVPGDLATVRAGENSALTGLSTPQRVVAVLSALALIVTGLVVASARSGASTSTTDSQSYQRIQIVKDNYLRKVASGFGRAVSGGSYVTSPKRAFSVHRRAGRIGPVSPGAMVGARLPAVSALNQAVRVSGSVPALSRSGNGSYLILQLRVQRNGDEYRARLRFAPGGALRLSLAKVVNRREVVVNDFHEVAVGSIRARGVVRVEAQVTGTSTAYLSVRAWRAGQPTPAWQYRWADPNPGPLASSGSLGVALYQSAQSGRGTLDLRTLNAWRLVPVKKGGASKPPASSSTSSTPSSAPSTSTPAPTSTSTSTSAPTPTPTPTSTSTTPPTTSGEVPGAAPLGSMRYSIPADAKYVAVDGNDATGDGSLANPFATVARAVSAVSSGGTVVLRGGVYNQSTSVFKTVTIENYPGEVVWFDGSIPVTSWQKTTNGWSTNYVYQFDSSASFSSGSDAGGFVSSQYPMAAHPDQAFLDGQQLTQVASSPGAGQFAVDTNAHLLTVGSDPTGHAMRVSTLQQAFVFGGTGIVLRGVGVRNYATSLPQMGTIYLGGSGGHDVVSNVVISNTATQALSVYSPYVLLDHLTVDHSGMTGIHATNSNSLTIQWCDIEYNNVEHFNAGPSAGGIKVTRLDGLTVSHNLVTNNIGEAGVWADENVINYKITSNVVTNNGREGCPQVQVELSSHGIIADNDIGNGKYGLTVFDSGWNEIYNNRFHGNAIWDVGLTQDNRWEPGMSTAGASVQPSTYNPWLVQSETIVNNDFSGTGPSWFQFYVLDKETNRSADSMDIHIEGNLFLTETSTSPSWPIGWGGSDNVTVTKYATPGAWSAAEGNTWANGSTTTGGPTLLSSTATPSYVVGLPSDVAAAISQPVGTRHLGTF